jgi:ribosome-associated protein
MRKSLLRTIQDILVDAKGLDIRVLDVRQLTDITDYMIIVNGTSTRHVQSVADKLVEGMRARGIRSLGVEGADIGEWVLVDFGDVVVHVMRPQTRQFYNLEKLWGGAEAPGGALEV